MFGDNPFSDTTVPSVPTTPRIRVAEINETNVVLNIEMVDDRGYPVVTLHRVCLRAGDAFPIHNLQIDMHVKEK